MLHYMRNCYCCGFSICAESNFYTLSCLNVRFLNRWYVTSARTVFYNTELKLQFGLCIIAPQNCYFFVIGSFCKGFLWLHSEICCFTRRKLFPKFAHGVIAVFL